VAVLSSNFGVPTSSPGLEGLRSDTLDSERHSSKSSLARLSLLTPGVAEKHLLIVKSPYYSLPEAGFMSLDSTFEKKRGFRAFGVESCNCFLT